MRKKFAWTSNPALWLGLFLYMLTAWSCSSEPQPLMSIVSGRIDVQANPFNSVPLGALVTFNTAETTQVEIEIKGELPVKRTFPTFKTSHSIPLIGLYAGTVNAVSIRLTTKKGQEFVGEVYVETAPLPAFLPEIDIVKLNREKMEPGFHLAEVLIANNGAFDAFPLMFDDNGAVRWYLDMSGVKPFPFTCKRLKNGNWLFVSWVELYEINDLGELIRHDRLSDYSADHDVIELDNGHLIMGASKQGSQIVREGKRVESRFDFLIELDKNRKVVREWDMRQVLDVDRSVFRKDFSLDFSADWFHFNSVAQSSDKGLIISGRNQGVLKVDPNNQLQWILAPHKAWGKAGFDGAGFETSEFLLTAIDGQGNPLPESIQEGMESSDEFEWPTGQHTVKELSNGHILLFDNGLSRNFENSVSYSRAVEYRIDEENKTIQQVWQYGKSRKLDMFSGITSSVQVLPATNNRLLTSGNVRLSELPAHAKMVEVTYPDNEVVFEANLFLKDQKGTGAQEWAQFDLLYKGARYPLYRGMNRTN